MIVGSLKTDLAAWFLMQQHVEWVMTSTCLSPQSAQRLNNIFSPLLFQITLWTPRLYGERLIQRPTMH